MRSVTKYSKMDLTKPFDDASIDCPVRQLLAWGEVFHTGTL